MRIEASVLQLLVTERTASPIGALQALVGLETKILVEYRRETDVAAACGGSGGGPDQLQTIPCPNGETVCLVDVTATPQVESTIDKTIKDSWQLTTFFTVGGVANAVEASQQGSRRALGQQQPAVAG